MNIKSYIHIFIKSNHEIAYTASRWRIPPKDDKYCHELVYTANRWRILAQDDMYQKDVYRHKMAKICHKI